ncbi:hypothetical protein NIES267_41480 [Calothrix parasitica NIES-267]|uniref:DUF1822 family protein n=1 Tax=Calothrix parasitica NIES-267 TaxID=1973488 RepID=A0A1Z4LTU7_9CYAN|nr:hypothetical protein NIES267_41480 [Calothrix parasitica NIES-267]
MNNNTIDYQKSVTIPLQEKAHDWARKFASAQTSVEGKKRVYLNTLAVYAVHTYLKWIQVETDLENSDSWNLAANAFFNVNDLELPNTGKLICCPVLPNEDSFTPPELLLPDSIAYIPVRFQEVLNEVEILGYRPIIDSNNPLKNIGVSDSDYLDEEEIEEGYDDGFYLFPIENFLNWLFNIQDIVEAIENGTSELIREIIQRLEVEERSPYQFAVESTYRVKECEDNEDMFPNNGYKLFASSTAPSGEINKMANQLRSSTKSTQESELSTTDDNLKNELEELGSQWLHFVKEIIE